MSVTLKSNISKGKDNKVVDSLSRKLNMIYSISISNYQSDIKQRIKSIAICDKEYEKLIKMKQNNETKILTTIN